MHLDINKRITWLSGVTTATIAFAIPVSTVLMNALFIVAVTLIICSGNLKEKISNIRDNQVALFFLALFCLFLVGLTYSSAPLGEGLKQVIKYNKFLLALFLFPVFTDETWRKYAMWSYIAAVMIILIVSYFRAFVFTHPDDLTYPAAVFKSPIETNLILAFAAYWFMQKVFRKGQFRWLATIILSLLIYNIIFLSTGRSGYFVFASLLILFLWQHLSWKGLLIAGISIIILAGSAFTFSHSFQVRVKEIQSDIINYQKGNKDTSVGLRIEFAKNSIELIKKHPFLGTGTGSFATEYAKTEALTKTQNPHNEYLNLGVQFGIPGILFLLMMFFTQLMLSRYLPKDLGELAQALVIAFAVGCLANSWLLDTTEGHFFVYFSALTFAALPKKRKLIREADREKNRA